MGTAGRVPAIEFKNVSKVFETTGREPGRIGAVWDVSLAVNEGELVVLLGPSGSGKTTLLRMVNRLIEPTSGEIFVGGREIHRIHTAELRRHIGYVIQQVGLFPHMTVEKNISVVPKLLGWDKGRIANRVEELLVMVDLSPAEYRKRYPRQLSGGQQQRVGIARAMAADPAVMLMDEPFGALDAITRTDLQNELLKIQGRVSKTIIFVTHDVEEALRLADRIAIVRDGGIVQHDRPLNLLAHPRDDFVRTLMGSEDVFRELSLVSVASAMQPLQQPVAAALTIAETESLRTALSLLIGHGADGVVVVDSSGKPVGQLTLARVLVLAAEGGTELAEIGTA